MTNVLRATVLILIWKCLLYTIQNRCKRFQPVNETLVYHHYLNINDSFNSNCVVRWFSRYYKRGFFFTSFKFGHSLERKSQSEPSYHITHITNSHSGRLHVKAILFS